MLIRRFIGVIPVLLGVSLIVFFLVRLAPGDPVELLLPEDASQADIERTKRDWGLDKPVPIQYLEFIKKAARGDFGTSYKFDEPVIELILERLPATLELGLVSFLVSLLIDIPIGVLSATRANTLIDHASMAFALMGASLPHFWLGIMLIFFLGGYLDLLPVSGRIDFGIGLTKITHLYLLDSIMTLNWSAFLNTLKHLVMPALTLGIALSALATRITRSSMLEVIKQDYITTARIKGLKEVTVIWKHGFRNALCTIITILGLQLGTLLAGSIIVETVFSWPGIGNLLIQAISYRDYGVVQGVALLFSVIYIVVNLVVDLMYTLVDPRVRI